jgi:predicted nucleic acid-binding protein
MKAAYVDTSVLVAIAFDEPGSARQAAGLAGFDRLIASNLLEAEFRAALSREGLADELAAQLLSGLSWVFPNRTLTPEIARVLAVDQLRGADLWHLACALFVHPRAGLTFLTLDRAQARAARKLGFDLV